jgi:hypothetical protein
MDIITTFIQFLTAITKLFSRPNKTPIWQQFATQKQGTLKSSSGDLYVEYVHKGFNFHVGSYTHYVVSGKSSYENMYMIGIVTFTNSEHFELSLSPDDLFAKLGKLLKNDEITIGNHAFDRQFLIKSNHPFKAAALLNHKALLEKTMLAKPTLLEITIGKGLFEEHHPSQGKQMLYFAKQEKFKDVNQLENIHNLLNLYLEVLKMNFSINY